MKKCHIILAGLLFSSIACSTKNQAKNCEDLKTGKFGFYGNRSGREYIIERNDSTQIEADEVSGSVIEFYINWPSPCEYDLIFKRHIKIGNDTAVLHRHYFPVKTIIMEIRPGYYIFKSTGAERGFELIDTMGISKSL